METKDKTREKAAPRKTRPAPGDRKPARKPAEARRPAAEGTDEVYIPEKQTREQHNRPERSGGEAGAKRPAPAKRKPVKKKQEETYRPYRRANAAHKAKRNTDILRSIRRFFSDQNPVLKLFYKEDPAVFGEQGHEARKNRREQEKEKQRRRAERLNTPVPVYINPVAFNSRRLAVQLLTVLAIVLALVLGMSVFFRVKVITVSGAKVYSAWTVREESGINEGDNLLTFGRTKASGKIIANLPYVKSARIGIKLPDTVNIEIEEAAVVYSIQDQSGVWWLINSDGKIVEQTSSISARNYTQVLGVVLFEPQAGDIGVAAESAPAVDAEGNPVPVLVTGAQRFVSALKILQALEDNDIVGDAASVDVSQLQDIILWYGTQYQVNLGSIDRMEYKIAYMKNAIMQMSGYQTGILDVSFTTWPDMAGYTPFG